MTIEIMTGLTLWSDVTEPTPSLWAEPDKESVFVFSNSRDTAIVAPLDLYFHQTPKVGSPHFKK